MRKLLFIPGFMGSREDFFPLFSELEQEYSISCYDLPGIGAVPLPKENLFSFLQREIAKQINSETILIGYSMGGRLAMPLAKLCRGAILISAHPGLRSDEEREARLKSDRVWIDLVKDRKLFLEKWAMQPLFQTLPQEIFDRRMAIPDETLVRYLKELTPAQTPSFWHCFPQNEVPLHFLFGELDEKYAKLHSDIQKIGGRVQSALLKNVGHALHIDNPKECAHAIRISIQLSFME